MDKEKEAVITLNLNIELTPKRIISLINYFGSAVNVLNASISDLMSVDELPERIAVSTKKIAQSNRLEKELKLAKDNGIDIVTYKDDAYPEQLSDIIDFPPVLYMKGKFHKSDKISVSIVGARRATNYGISVTSNFCKYFAENDICVVSGLASGIDSQAHKATLENKGRTIAVLGNGLLECYPPENKKLQEKVATEGVLISEYSLFQRPDKILFPRRNRIIAGLSMATIVIEAAQKSGSLITAELACEYGRDVFAVPGPIFSKYSQGPNSLIKNGSLIALKPDDVVEAISNLALWVTQRNKKKKNLTIKTLNDITDSRNAEILKIINETQNGISIDELSLITKREIADLAMTLMDFELNGLVKVMPGQVYIRNK
ncbi:DNA-processing protein DprA [Candidatus Ruminimicrobium bovinum]|uniref:DNA-processing protein DprA n=1 Tax=Candidatus Ruminimicrobium bovinum TaxID=3242779 RepID=UPI0039B898B9